jgi:hypothetical protein
MDDLDFPEDLVEINGAMAPRFGVIARLHHAVQEEKEERQEAIQRAIDVAQRQYNDAIRSARTSKLRAISAFAMAVGVEYGIDYVQNLFKPKDEDMKEKQIMKIIKTSKLKDFEIVSTKYDNIINRLISVDKTVNNLLGKDDVRTASLLDEIRYGVIASHLKVVKDFSSKTFLEYFKIGSWCGLNTDIPQALMREKLEKPFQFNKIDGICKLHDLAYLNAKNKDDIAKADREMLLNILDTYTLSGISKLELNVFKEYTLKSVYDTLLSFFGNINIPKTITQITGLYEIYKPTKAGEPMSVKKGLGAYALLRDKLTAIFTFGVILLKTVGEKIYGDTAIQYYPETLFDEGDIQKLISEYEDYQNQRLVDAGYEPYEEENETVEIKEEEDDSIYEENELENEVEEDDSIYEENILENEVEE